MRFGFADVGSRHAYDRALALAADAGDRLLQFRAQMGRCILRVMNEEHDGLEEIAAWLLAAAEDGHPELTAAAHLYNAFTSHGLGDFEAAVRHALLAEQALPWARRDVPFQTDLAASVQFALVLGMTAQGELEGARWHRELAVARLDSHAAPYQRISNLALLAALAMQANEPDAALELAEKSIAVGEEYGLEVFAALARCCRSWALCVKEWVPIDALAAAVEERDGLGELWYQPLLFVRLAEIWLARGRSDRARRWLARAAARDARAFRGECERLRRRLEPPPAS